ncbi:MAG: NAD(P)-binding domain-containing protein [Pleurocapsa sp. MO_192.B19]|nr:NAD(P)-binding domain-containing protein [Pleurocapsa sp. MO_192.B19]
MKIGIIGSGNIGGNLGKHWAKVGHEVMFSSRHPEELKPMAEKAGAKTGTTEETAAFGEVILLAIPYGKVPDLAQQIGNLDNKILIDAANPYPQRDGDVAQKVIDDKSQTATGYVASQFPGAKTVKAFNSIYFKVIEETAFRSEDDRIAVQVCSDDEQAKETVKQLIEEIGFAPQDLGDLSKGVLFEPYAPLYNQNLKIGEAEKLLSQIQ